MPARSMAASASGMPATGGTPRHSSSCSWRRKAPASASAETPLSPLTTSQQWEKQSFISSSVRSAEMVTPYSAAPMRKASTIAG